MKKITWFVFLLGLSGFASAGGSLDIGLSQESIRVEHDATRIGTGMHLTAGMLYQEEDGYALSAGFNAVDVSNPDSDLIGGLGIKGFVYDSHETAFSAAVGGFVRYSPDFLNGLGFEGLLYYSPDVISFNDTRSFYELVARVTYKVMPQARLFIGYQDVTADYKEVGEKPIDRAFTIGFRINY
ncbi:YfaZ family outer membrane protein [Gynuella sunshinyii]|uniref:YfaZ family outer membrane protein n=1 Tax=Gynuella sunshinyii TaxID=1445505 RepID=UPI0005CC35AF|nr:YfaZ family outer membrane protein [Gynuella sunshinyii]